jgi:agmatinase
VRALIEGGCLPVVLGGDHAITYPVLRAYDREVTLVQFDAHMDFQDYAGGYKYGHASPMRAISDDLPSVKRIVHAGIRAFRTAEQEVRDSRDRGNCVLSTQDLRRDPSWVEAIPDGSPVYLTLDMDVLDPPLAPGVNAPEPDGLQFGELCEYIRKVADHHEIVGIDVAEVNPLLDANNQLTAFLAVQLLVFTMGEAARSEALHGSGTGDQQK